MSLSTDKIHLESRNGSRKERVKTCMWEKGNNSLCLRENMSVSLCACVKVFVCVCKREREMVLTLRP